MLNRIVKSAYFKSLKWGVSSMFTNFFKQLFLVPIFILSVGKEGYAFWVIISALALMVRALNLGQLNYCSNNINLQYHIKSDIYDDLSTNQGANLIMLAFQILVGLAIAFSPLLNYITDYDIEYLTSVNASYSLVLLVFSAVIYQYSTLYLLRLFEPIGKINLTIKYQTLGELFDFLITAAVIYFTRNIFYTCLILSLVYFIYSILIVYVVMENVPFKLPIFRGLDFRKSFLQIYQALFLTFSFMIEKIYEIGLNLVISRAYSAKLLPLFSTNRVLSNSSLRVSNIMTIPLMPNIQKQFALNDKEGIVKKTTLFWRISSSMLIFGITIIIPFIPYLFSFWTLNKIEFNYALLYFLLLAIVFQNYAMILVELLKKTNLSKQLLIYNLIKVTATISIIFAGGYYHRVDFMGLSLLVGELLSLIYLLQVSLFLFEKGAIKKLFISLIPLILFSISFTVYFFNDLYFLFAILNIGIILFTNRFFLKNS